MDDGELAGYVDVGIFELEHWMARNVTARRYRDEGLRKLAQHLELLGGDED